MKSSSLVFVKLSKILNNALIFQMLLFAFKETAYLFVIHTYILNIPNVCNFWLFKTCYYINSVTDFILTCSLQAVISMARSWVIPLWPPAAFWTTITGTQWWLSATVEMSTSPWTDTLSTSGQMESLTTLIWTMRWEAKWTE